MQPGVSNQPMPQQPYGSGNSSGRGCGCFAFGCGGVLLGLVGLCVAGYYTLFFSNVPLVMIKQALEDSGNVKIEGLKGNFSSGFEMKTLRFKDPELSRNGLQDEKWSELNDIRVKYRNGGMFANSFTVEDISIAGGTIYADLKFNGELSEDLVFDELQDDFGNFQSEFSNNSRGTLNIKKVSFCDLKLCDPETDEEFNVDEISLTDVLIEDGRLVEFGDLVVKADSIDLETVRTSNIADAQLERTIKGSLQKGALSNVLSDLPFEIEFGVFANGRIAARSRWFDGQILSVTGFEQEPNRFQMTGFSPGERIRVRDSVIVPSDIHLDVIYDTKKRQQIGSVDSGGHLMLGASRFENFRLPENAEDGAERQFILTTAEVDGQQIEAELYLLRQFPLVGLKLRKVNEWSLEDTWARAVFGQPYGELSEAQRDGLQASISLAERRFSSRESSGSKRARRGRDPSRERGGEDLEERSEKETSENLGESERGDARGTPEPLQRNAPVKSAPEGSEQGEGEGQPSESIESGDADGEGEDDGVEQIHLTTRLFPQRFSSMHCIDLA